MSNKVIRDSIHGDIFLTQDEIEVVDTPEFQRLRRVNQLGMTSLVYPSANHTRFEHSLGTLHLAGKMAERLELEGEKEKLIRLAALLHDVGHGPLSHTSEVFLSRHLRISHEQLSVETISRSPIAMVLEEQGFSVSELSEAIYGQRGFISKIISSEVDVDRMDYLVRDAHHTGVGYGIIDLDRLINTAEIRGDLLTFDSRGLRAIEGLLVARFLMIPSVYLHHTSRIADAMFLKAAEHAISEGKVSFRELMRMDDLEVFSLLRNSPGYLGEMGERFDTRKLFKTALIKGWHDIPPPLRERIIATREDGGKMKRIVEELSEEAGVEEKYIILDIPPQPAYKEMDALVGKEGRLLKVEEESPLVGVLKVAQKNYWSMGIYTPREHSQKVGEVAEELENFF